jgi:DNA (cytosine-5)-methyltransferase 1
MDPNDPRSQHVWTFTDVVEKFNPSVFLMENVKALGKLKKWAPLREKLLERFRSLGYATNFVVLNASEFDVPQARERVFFIGFKMNSTIVPDLEKMLDSYKKMGKTVRESIGHLDKAGTGNNSGISKAKITITANPILRKSPFAGMMFNGLGRPIKLEGYSATLPASMGGNKTPIIDNEELYNNETNWVVDYHTSLMNGGEPMEYQVAPSRLRRLTIQEASLIQTFPKDYEFQGSQSSIFKQIGNAVPCNLAERLGNMLMNYLVDKEIIDIPYQLQIEELNV